jgi:hypothetical protein
MKRSLLAAFAVLALGSASAYAQTAGVEPSFNDAPDIQPIPLTGGQTVDQKLPKGSMNSGGPRGPASVVIRGNDGTSPQHAQSSVGATRSDATAVDGNDSNNSKNSNTNADGLPPTLNDTFHYPSSD